MSDLELYVGLAILNILTVAITHYLHKGVGKVEDEVRNVLPAEDAVKVNDFLETLDKLTEAAVSNANSLVVGGLKEKNLFTSETAAAVKQSVVSDVMDNLGPLKDKSVGLIGPLENIVGQLIEKHVIKPH